MIVLAEAIYNDLAVHDGILGYIAAADIYWMAAPEGAGADRIVFKMVSDPALYDSDDKWQRWRFYVTHTDPHQCLRLATVLFEHLHRKDDTFDTFKIDYVSNNENNDPEYVEDLKAYQIIQDYMIYYH